MSEDHYHSRFFVDDWLVVDFVFLHLDTAFDEGKIPVKKVLKFKKINLAISLPEG